MLERQRKRLPPIWTMDLETDPFMTGKIPQPFLCGLFDGFRFTKFWSDSQGTCIEKVKRYLLALPEEERGIVYMHNGGRFDFFYMLDWFEGKVNIINSRIIKATMQVEPEKKDSIPWEFRDSYAIMPFPLRDYKKDEIEMSHLTKVNRYKYAKEIESYLYGDCRYLWELCMEFYREFGDYLTIASAAFKQLTDRHHFDVYRESEDHEIRSQFYYGGRVQCFQKGIIEQPCNIYDTNSMYPAVMQNFEHPTTWCSLQDAKVRWSAKDRPGKDFRTFFVVAQGKNFGAFPKRLENGLIDFTVPHGIFCVTIHEWLAALELGLFEPEKIIATYNYMDWSNFKTFVQDFYTARKQAKESGDQIRTLFYKYILNSAYGKFAINPENYANWQITYTPEPPAAVRGKPWELDTFKDGAFYVWKQKTTSYSWSFKNVATGSSITGAARSVLLRAIAASKGVVYCDTDSLICEKFAGGKVDPLELGAWKCEASGTMAAIAGKKMYAVFDGPKCIKQANKGVLLSAEDIVKVCQGENVMSVRDAPTFQRTGDAKFVSRTVRMT